jgi:hypothetical protein
MFHIFTIILLFLALASGVALVAISFGYEIKGSSAPFWLLYTAGFLGSIGLSGKIAGASLQRSVIMIASAFQIVLGIIAAILIFLDKLKIINIFDTLILWILFLFGLTVGIWGISRISDSKTSE